MSQQHHFFVCPLGRHSAKVLRQNVVQQRGAFFYVIAVENGLGLGACDREFKDSGWRPSLVLRCQRNHPGAAKNIGLLAIQEFAKEHGVEATFSTMDDDDYYGPLYARELHEEFAKGRRVVGKAAHFTKLSNDHVVLFSGTPSGEMLASCEVPYLEGPTISSVVWPGMPLFSEEMPFGEDADWCDRVRAAGERIHATSIYNWCYMRYGLRHRHTFQVRDEQLLGLATGDVYDVGGWGTGALRTINGQRGSLDGLLKLIDVPELPFEDHPGLAAARRMAGISG